MHDELDQHQERHLPRHARERPQRHRHAEREQRAGRRRVLEELQQPVERDRRLDVQRRRGNAERGRDHERMQQDLARHVEDHAARRRDRSAAPAPSSAAAARRTAASRSRRSARPAPPPARRPSRAPAPAPCSRCCRRRRPAPRSRIRQACGATARRDRTTAASTRKVPSVVARMNAHVVELLERRLGQDAEEQRRQRQIDDEKIHPRQAAVGNALEPPTGEAQEDQAEIGQREVEDVDHSGAFGAIPKCQRRTWRGACFPLNGRPAF